VAAVANVLLHYLHEQYRQSELYAGDKSAILLDGSAERAPLIEPPPRGPEQP
jgi:hypothetical protein